MEIGRNQPFAGPDSFARTGSDTSARSTTAHPFTSFLKTQGDAAKNLSASSESQGGESADAAEDDVEFIRENGFQAYLERNHERKLEEMREQILIQMGLSEESLAAMPAEHRALMEKLITEAIQVRLAAEAESNHSSVRRENAVVGHDDPALAPMALLESSGRMQAMVGFSIVDAVTDPDMLAGEDGDRQVLPTTD